MIEDCSGDVLQAGAGNLSNLIDAFQAELPTSMARMKEQTSWRNRLHSNILRQFTLAAKSAVHVAPNRSGRSISRWTPQIYCSGFRRKRFLVLLLAFFGFSSASARLLRLLVGIRPDEYIRTSCFSFYTLLLSPSSLLFPLYPDGR